MRRLIGVVVLALVWVGVVLTTPTPADAHPGVRALPWTEAPAVVNGAPLRVGPEISGPVAASRAESAAASSARDYLVPWLAVAALATVVGVLFRSRRMIVIALVALVAVGAVETTIHSVHHLGDAREAAKCGVAVAGAHLNGHLVAPVVVAAPAVQFVLFALPDDRSPSVRIVRPDEGRAPPA